MPLWTSLLLVTGALAQAEPVTHFFATLPAQELACLDGWSSGPEEPEAWLEQLYVALGASRVSTFGVPFLALLEEGEDREAAGEPPAEGGAGALGWTVCAPVGPGVEVQPPLRLEVRQEAPAAFAVCTLQEEDCADALAIAVAAAGREAVGLPRSVPLRELPPSASPEELAALFADVAAVRLDPPEHEPAAGALDPVDLQLVGLGERREQPRALFTAQREVEAAPAVTQEGVLIAVEAPPRAPDLANAVDEP
jgi:hypothetical protein